MLHPATLALACAAALASAANAQTIVSGQIGKQTWTAVNSPYIIESDVRVVGNGTLTIEPGVEVRFNPGTSLIIGTISFGRPTIAVLGTADNPVLFTSNAPYLPDPRPAQPGDWGSISISTVARDVVFDDDGNPIDGCRFQHAIFEFADGSGDSGGAIKSPRIAIAVQDCEFRDILGCAVRTSFVQTKVLVERSTFERCISTADTLGTGVSIGAGEGTIIRQCTFRDTATAIDVSALDGLLVTDHIIERCSADGDAVRLDGVRTALVERLHFQDCGNADTLVTIRRSQDTVTLREVSAINNRQPDGQGPTMVLLVDTAQTIIQDSVFADGFQGIAIGDTAGTTIERCEFTRLERLDRGTGGAMLIQGDGSVTARDCQFTANLSREYAGAVAIAESAGPTLFDNCDFIGNGTTGGTPPDALDQGGGAMYIRESGPVTIANSTFRGNGAQDGGAILIEDSEALTVTNTRFLQNAAISDGGAIAVRGTQTTVNLSSDAQTPPNIFAGNIASFLGDNIANFLPPAPDGTNTINATGVCWNTTDPTAIADSIHDNADDPTLAGVNTNDPAPCPADPLPCSPIDLAQPLGALSFADATAFLSAFVANDIDADLATPYGRFTNADILVFLSLFPRGCP